MALLLDGFLQPRKFHLRDKLNLISSFVILFSLTIPGVFLLVTRLLRRLLFMMQNFVFRKFNSLLRYCVLQGDAMLQ